MCEDSDDFGFWNFFKIKKIYVHVKVVPVGTAKARMIKKFVSKEEDSSLDDMNVWLISKFQVHKLRQQKIFTLKSKIAFWNFFKIKYT